REGKRRRSPRRPNNGDDGARQYLSAVGRIAALGSTKVEPLDRKCGGAYGRSVMAVDTSGCAPGMGDAVRSRRCIVAACLATLAALLLPHDGRAQTYPDRTIQY